MAHRLTSLLQGTRLLLERRIPVLWLMSHYLRWMRQIELLRQEVEGVAVAVGVVDVEALGGAAVVALAEAFLEVENRWIICLTPKPTVMR